MVGFFDLRLDFVYFLHGIALALIASSAWGLSHIVSRRTWFWLALFGASQAAFVWLKAVTCDLGDSNILYYTRVLLLGGSFFCLVQFARRKLFGMGIMRLNRWIHIGPAGLLLVGIFWLGPEFTRWYMPVLGVLSGILGGISLLARARSVRQKIDEANRLRQCAFAIGSYTIVMSLLALHRDFPSKSNVGVEPDWFPLIMTIGCALLAAFACWSVGYHYSLLHHSKLVEQGTKSWSRKRTVQATIILLIVAVGWFAAERSIKAKDASMRRDILLRASLVAAAVPPDHIATLQWSDADLANPNYQEIKKRMMALVATNKDMRFVMLTGLRDGKAYFLADSEKPDSPDYSPPGQYYEEADAEYLSGCEKRAPFVLGPVVDRWGTWITASVPIGEFGPDKRWVMAEIDITAANWADFLRESRLLAVMITLLITLLLITFFYAQDRIHESLARLTTSEQRTSTLVEGSPNCVQMFTPGGICTTINQNGLNALDRRRDEIIGKHFLSIWPEHMRERIRESFEFSLTGHSTVFESEYHRPDGVVIIWRVALTPMLDEQRQIRSLVSIGVDISDLKQTEKDLLSAKDAAESANRTKSEFLAVMSHEIRTPLGGVIGMLNALRKHALEPEQQLYTELAHENAENLLGMLDDILDAAKVEAGKLTLETIAFDPALEFSRVLEPMRIRAEAKALAFSWKLAPDLPPVLHGDPTRLRQVLANFLSNALKFTESGSIKTNISTTPDGADRFKLWIEVTDTGIGIEKEKLARLFNRFEQADSSTTRRFGGTGLGLSIVKNLAELMHGEVQVNSTPGVSTTFRFTASVRPGTPAELASMQGTATPFADLPRHRARLHILCAEDDLTNQVAAEFLVKQMGHTIEFVDDGEKAIDWLSCNHADVVLMDNRMPNMDGFQATKLIRAPETIVLNHNIYIIANTANTASGYRERCLAAGMNDYLTKPLREDELHAALEKAILHLEKNNVTLPGHRAATSPAFVGAALPAHTPKKRPSGLSEAELLAILDEAEAKPVDTTQLPAEAIQRIAEQYFIEAPLRLAEMRAALDKPDSVTLARAAHSLKGTSRYVQAETLAKLCAEIEKLADGKQFGPLPGLISNAENEYSTLCSQRKPANPAVST